MAHKDGTGPQLVAPTPTPEVGITLKRRTTLSLQDSRKGTFGIKQFISEVLLYLGGLFCWPGLQQQMETGKNHVKYKTGKV